MTMNGRIALLALLFLAGQIAPAVHALLPHEEEAVHCRDGNPFEHFEPHVDHPEHDDCELCTRPVGSGTALDLWTPVPTIVSVPAGAAVPDTVSPRPLSVSARPRAPPPSAA